MKKIEKIMWFFVGLIVSFSATYASIWVATTLFGTAFYWVFGCYFAYVCLSMAFSKPKPMPFE